MTVLDSHGGGGNFILEMLDPRAENDTKVDLDRFEQDVINSPTLLPDAFLVAVDGNEYIGMTQLWADRASDMLFTGLTGVRQGYRRQGIALALKVRAIAYAKASGNPTIITDNEMTNRPMLSINERLGFQRKPAWIEFRKDCYETQI